MRYKGWSNTLTFDISQQCVCATIVYRSFNDAIRKRTTSRHLTKCQSFSSLFESHHTNCTIFRELYKTISFQISEYVFYFDHLKVNISQSGRHIWLNQRHCTILIHNKFDSMTTILLCHVQNMASDHLFHILFKFAFYTNTLYEDDNFLGKLYCRNWNWKVNEFATLLKSININVSRLTICSIVICNRRENME